MCCPGLACTQTTFQAKDIAGVLLALAIRHRISVRLCPIGVGVWHLCGWMDGWMDGWTNQKGFTIQHKTDPWDPRLELHARHAPSYSLIHVSAAAHVPVAFA